MFPRTLPATALSAKSRSSPIKGTTKSRPAAATTPHRATKTKACVETGRCPVQPGSSRRDSRPRLSSRAQLGRDVIPNPHLNLNQRTFVWWIKTGTFLLWYDTHKVHLTAFCSSLKVSRLFPRPAVSFRVVGASPKSWPRSSGPPATLSLTGKDEQIGVPPCCQYLPEC